MITRRQILTALTLTGTATAISACDAPTDAAPNTPPATSTPASSDPSSSASTSATSTPATSTPSAADALIAEDATHVQLPAPGSGWEPPKITAEMARNNDAMRKVGYTVEYVDPAVALATKKRTVEQPTMPETDLTRDELGAVRMVDMYFRALDYLYVTGDPEILTSISAPDLDLTNRVIREHKEYAVVSGHVTCDPIYVEELRIVDKTETAMTLQGTVHYPPVSVYIQQSSMLFTSPDLSGPWEIRVVWGADNYWVVISATRLEPNAS